jgi:hypothetical protein
VNDLKGGHKLGKDERRKIAGEHLKNADKYIKDGDFDKASEEVDKALIVDPENFYAIAYKDRIYIARQKVSINPKGDKHKEAEIPKLSAEEKRKIEEDIRQRTLGEARKKIIEKQQREAEGLKIRAEEERKLAEEELRRRAAELETLRHLEEEKNIKESGARRIAEEK